MSGRNLTAATYLASVVVERAATATASCQASRAESDITNSPRVASRTCGAGVSSTRGMTSMQNTYRKLDKVKKRLEVELVYSN